MIKQQPAVAAAQHAVQLGNSGTGVGHTAQTQRAHHGVEQLVAFARSTLDGKQVRLLEDGRW
ncbi:hypothetical protein GCM10022267_90310 [Lentzea roselyniae]|uniref:Uncharacterized protein n=1 Tax=Lentzea roselyniae TaxID=531940 RepID=A0ABP7CIY9_9PSEU